MLEFCSLGTQIAKFQRLFSREGGLMLQSCRLGTQTANWQQVFSREGSLMLEFCSLGTQWSQLMGTREGPFGSFLDVEPFG